MTSLAFPTMQIRSGPSLDRLTLRRLGRRILRMDRQALDALHHRRVFYYRGKHLCMVDFVQALTYGPIPQQFGASQEMAQCAADLTVDRFLLLGDGKTDGLGPFLAWLEALDRWSESYPGVELLAEEAKAAELLQGLVIYHFGLCLREARRVCTTGSSRYTWPLPTGSLQLIMPMQLQRQERPLWLERHVPDVDPTRSGEQQRVQQIIDHHFPSPDVRPLNDYLRENVVAHDGEPLSWLLEHELTVWGLAQAVIREKVTGIDRLPKTLRQLGGAKLAALIDAMLHAIADETYSATALGQFFGMSKSAMTRVAAENWKTNNSKVAPLMWRNVACVLNANPEFAEAARQMGVWDQVQAVLHGCRPKEANPGANANAEEQT